MPNIELLPDYGPDTDAALPPPSQEMFLPGGIPNPQTDEGRGAEVQAMQKDIAATLPMPPLDLPPEEARAYKILNEAA